MLPYPLSSLYPKKPLEQAGQDSSSEWENSNSEKLSESFRILKEVGNKTT